MVRRGFRGWEVDLSDGTSINEDQMDWKDVPKQGITRLTLHYDGRRWDINNKPEYIQRKRASVAPGMPESFRIESRSIGYFDRGDKVLYTVDEYTGRMTMEVENTE